ncbi:hypothetical protein TELCIR_24685 [Teladorsagia circumcincta]|uniref:Uncharacterized protein n=1 Tax=Teladorsagia circumcincta TaxID=45464 RepID=A0A2G9T7N3_TELCI|nr:hypothetical protein TELCIR_24685 [Teladorsagia circumcincta]
MLKRRYESRGESWDESGPSISEHCSLSTEPSVHIRQEYWDKYQSPTASLSSFDYEVQLPSPDYQKIGRPFGSSFTAITFVSVGNYGTTVAICKQSQCSGVGSMPTALLHALRSAYVVRSAIVSYLRAVHAFEARRSMRFAAATALGYD